ncbi:MAG TPA: hypothetical protein VGT82_15760, partial [Ktedonobacteraceae bacterium]|nr:hypothetical protein [Ktedonobacteraceae bacterium]
MDIQPTPASTLHTVARGVSRRDEPIPLHEVAVLLHPNDDVAIARIPLGRGVVLRLPADKQEEGR